jgi:hypothetical protein
MSPVDAMRFRWELGQRNAKRLTEEEKQAIGRKNMWDLLYMTPIVGNVLSGMDVPGYFRAASQHAGAGDKSEARKNMLLAELSALGAISGLPLARFMGRPSGATRDASRSMNTFAGPTAKKPNEVTVYHGTANEFERFDPNYFGQRTQGRGPGEKPNRTTERAFAFSDDPAQSSGYAIEHQGDLASTGLDPEKMRQAYQASLNDSGQMIPEIFQRERQKLLDENFKSGARVFKAHIDIGGMKNVDMSGYRWNADEGKRLRKALNDARKEGYKGLIVKGMTDGDGSTATQYLTWTPGTVRSALSDNQLFSFTGIPADKKHAGAAVRGTGEKLPADEASRMARAKQMGFRTGMDLYHGTNQDINAFDLGKGGRTSGSSAASRGVSVALDPQTAGEFADLAAGKQGSGQNILRLLHRADRPAVLSLDGTERNHEIAATLDDLWSRGYDAVMMKNYTTPGGEKGRTILVVKDPSQLRSPNAQFDPAKRSSADLLAGIAGATVGGPAIYGATQGGDSR